MNIYIMADIEGISGIYAPEQVSPSLPHFQEGRTYMTEEVNVCAEACRAAGADRIYVRDAHGGSYSLIWESLTDAADGYICGRAENVRFPALEKGDGMILLGYHAMAGTPGAVLEHTMSSTSVQGYRLNGRPIGEIALDAAIAAEHGVPVLLVTGDDKACAEAKAFLPQTAVCPVKTGISTYGSILLPRQTAHQRLRQAVIDALTAPWPEVFTVPSPVRLQIEVPERSLLPSALGKPYMTILDGHTYEICADTLEQALFLA